MFFHFGLAFVHVPVGLLQKDLHAATLAVGIGNCVAVSILKMELLAAAFVRKTGMKVQISFFPQFPVLFGEDDLLDGFFDQQGDNEDHNDDQRFFNLVDLSGIALGAVLCGIHHLVCQLEVFFAHADDIGIFVAFFADLCHFFFQLGPIAVEPIQFCVVIGVLQMSQVVFSAAVS